MKALVVVLAALLTLTACTDTWSGPVRTRTVATDVRGRVHDIVFVNDTLGFACGGERYTTTFILRTRDGGSTWQTVLDEDRTGLYALDFFDAQRGVVCGYSGLVYRTEDGGSTWQRWQHDSYDFMQSVRMIDTTRFILYAGEGFQEGTVHYPTTPDWFFLERAPLEPSLTCDHRFTDGELLTAGYGAMFRSMDGGATWTPLDVRGDFYLDMDFSADDVTGLVCGFDGSILRTTDRGQTWQTVQNTDRAFSSRQRFYAIDLAPGGWAVVAGEGDDVLVSNDDGRSFQVLERDVSSNWLSVSWAWPGRFFLGGEDGLLVEVSLD